MTDGYKIERRAKRLLFEAEIDLRRTRNLKYRVSIRDFSPEGASLNLVDRVELGETIWIKLDGMESLESKVRWTRDFVAGVKFETPLHPSVFAMLVRRQLPRAASADVGETTAQFEKPA